MSELHRERTKRRGEEADIREKQLQKKVAFFREIEKNDFFRINLGEFFDEEGKLATSTGSLGPLVRMASVRRKYDKAPS